MKIGSYLERGCVISGFIRKGVMLVVVKSKTGKFELINTSENRKMFHSEKYDTMKMMIGQMR